MSLDVTWLLDLETKYNQVNKSIQLTQIRYLEFGYQISQVQSSAPAIHTYQVSTSQTQQLTFTKSVQVTPSKIYPYLFI